jgi:hypothetical protein
VKLKVKYTGLYAKKAGRAGNFFFVGKKDAVGAGSRRLESRMGQGRVGEVSREVGEVEDRERGIGSWVGSALLMERIRPWPRESTAAIRLDRH